jgi:hypothetical protein
MIAYGTQKNRHAKPLANLRNLKNLTPYKGKILHSYHSDGCGFFLAGVLYINRTCSSFNILALLG